jgi:hypothetical protein
MRELREEFIFNTAITMAKDVGSSWFLKKDAKIKSEKNPKPKAKADTKLSLNKKRLRDSDESVHNLKAKLMRMEKELQEEEKEPVHLKKRNFTKQKLFSLKYKNEQKASQDISDNLASTIADLAALLHFGLFDELSLTHSFCTELLSLDCMKKLWEDTLPSKKGQPPQDIDFVRMFFSRYKNITKSLQELLNDQTHYLFIVSPRLIVGPDGLKTMHAETYMSIPPQPSKEPHFATRVIDYTHYNVLRVIMGWVYEDWMKNVQHHSRARSIVAYSFRKDTLSSKDDLSKIEALLMKPLKNRNPINNDNDIKI